MKDWTPSKKELEDIIGKYNEDSTYAHYRHEDAALKLVFIDLLPNNTKVEDILVKVALLNDFYSTMIIRTDQVAEHILNIKDIDERLKEGDRNLVNEIANVSITSLGGESKDRNFFSFATKFCCNHQPEKYAIYDRFVAQALWKFIKEDLKGGYKQADLRDYPKFHEIIEKFRDYYHLDCGLRDLDRYLWIHGKDEEEKKNLIKLCRYYKGEEACPYDTANEAALWHYERAWVYDTLNNGNILDEYENDYSLAGLSLFAATDDVPASLRAMLYNRFHKGSMCALGEDAEQFKEFYRKYYH